MAGAEAGELTLDLLFAWVLYGIHMLSLPFWLRAAWVAARKQRQKRLEVAAGTPGASLPTEGEYYGIRLLAVYVICDALRGVDLCFDGTDGACRAVWGIVPLSVRMTAWGLRDVALLGAIGLNLDYILGWTHVALGWEVPRSAQRLLHGTFAFVICGILGCMYGLMATNRQSWQAYVVLFVVVLNAVWARTNLMLLRRVLPELEKRYGAPSAEQEALEVVGAWPKERVLPPWMGAAVAETCTTVRLILTANIGILLLFPFAAAERLILKSASERAFIYGAPLGSWVGSEVAPLLTERPLDVAVNPALEIVELLIGWLQLLYVVGVTAKTAQECAPWGPKGSLRPVCGYISQENLGLAIRAEAGTKED